MMQLAFFFIQDLIALPKALFRESLGKRLLFLVLGWEGKSPPLALKIKLLRDAKVKISKKSILRCLDYKALKLIEESTSFFHKQEIKKNRDEDHKLLNLSWINFYPHEVTQIKIKNKQEEIFESKISHGGPYRGAGLKELQQQASDLCFKARKKGLIVEEIQIVHTHPCLEVMITTQKESSFIFNGLSQGDIKIGQALAPFLPYPLRVKAITTAANYSMLF